MSQLDAVRDKFETFYQNEVDSYFPKGAAHFEACRYSLSGKGKRLRPLLCLSVNELVRGNEEWAKIAAVAIEMVHTYSLVHDDLPAMDDDDVRRGVSTCHKVFGEDVGILAGDALLTEAFSYLTTKLQQAKCPDHLILKMVQMLASKAGAFGMIWGQVTDLHPGDLNLEKILWIHELKTAKLFQASLQMGSFCQGEFFPSPNFDKSLESFGKELGIVFQLLDDLDDWSQHKKGELNVLEIMDLDAFFEMTNQRFAALWKDLESLTNLPANKTLLGELIELLEHKYNQAKELSCSL